MPNTQDEAKVLLLDGLACAGHVATGLSVIKDRCDDGETVLKTKDVRNLKLYRYVDTLNHVEDVGRKKVQSICPQVGVTLSRVMTRESLLIVRSMRMMHAAVLHISFGS